MSTSHRQRLVGILAVSALTLAGCSGQKAAEPEVETTTVAVTTAAPSSEPASPSETSAESSAPQNSTPESSTPESSAPESPSPSASSTERELVKHDPTLKQLTAGWITVDLPPGWQGEQHAVEGKAPVVIAGHVPTHTNTQLAAVDDVRVKGHDIGASNAGMCGAMVKTRSEEFEPGWKEGPTSTLAMPQGLHGFSCGIKGVMGTNGGALTGKNVEMLITSIAKDNGQAIVQVTVFPVTTGNEAAAQAGRDAVYMLRQAVLNWTGQSW